MNKEKKEIEKERKNVKKLNEEKENLSNEEIILTVFDGNEIRILKK